MGLKIATRITLAQEKLEDWIVHCHDDLKMTFREIANENNCAGSWAFKLYKKGKQRARS